MHYSNGREAKVGDKIVARDTYKKPFLAVVTAVNAGATTCNLSVTPLATEQSVTARDCQHLEDVFPPTTP